VVKLLIDTNVLLRASQPASDQFENCVRAVEHAPAAGFTACLVPQVIYEYWAVATRPAEHNGLGFDSVQASLEIRKLSEMLSLLRDERGIFERWQSLVKSYAVQGKCTHDARLVAAMERHRIEHLLTLNPKDFNRYSGITVHHPTTFVSI
jgi:predicted nucleic acid-binding protein